MTTIQRRFAERARNLSSLRPAAAAVRLASAYASAFGQGVGLGAFTCRPEQAANI
ncbi:MAG: hypothetical protein ACKVZH_17665 [Blastocatellia bacterium]